MPALKRIKTDYPGVVHIIGTSIKGKPEKIFYIRYHREGKLIEEKAGRQYQDAMTPARSCTDTWRACIGQAAIEYRAQEAT